MAYNHPPQRGYYGNQRPQPRPRQGVAPRQPAAQQGHRVQGSQGTDDGYYGDGFWAEYSSGSGEQPFDPRQAPPVQRIEQNRPRPPQFDGGFPGPQGAPGQHPYASRPEAGHRPPNGYGPGGPRGFGAPGPGSHRGSGPQFGRGQGMRPGPAPHRGRGPNFSPPRQAPNHQPLVSPPEPTMAFDNPFPAFPPNPQRSATMPIESGMSSMNLNGRSSSDNQRPSTSASKTSAKSSNSLHSEHSYYSTDATSYNNSREPSSMDNHPPFDMGPIDLRGPARSMTMPQGPSVNQNTSTRPGEGLDFGLGPRDPVDMRSNTTIGARNPSSSHRPRDTLDEYMPNFDAVQAQPSPLEDSLGLPLDGTPGIARPPTRVGTAPPMQNQLQRTKSQPDLRGNNDEFAFGPPGAPAVPRMPDNYGHMGNGFRSGSPGPNHGRGMMGAPGPYGPSHPGPGPGFGPPVRPGLATAPRNGLAPGPVPIRPGLPGRLNTAQGWPDGNPGAGPFSAPAGPSSDPFDARSPQSNPDALPFHPSPGVPNEPPPPRSQPNMNQPAPAPEKPVTYLELNDLRELVKANPTDYKTQFKLAKRLVEAAAVLSDEEGNADQKTKNKNREKFIFEAHKNIKKLVQHSYTEAMFYLADCYGTGQLGLAVDHKEAFNLYQAAAKLGHGPAAYRTAVCCEVGGEGARRDPVKSVQWYRKAAALGEVGAMYKLGMVLLKGLLGQQSSIGEAVIWLNRAAERADEGNPHAVHELALLHEYPPPGGKIMKDEQYSLQLYEQAAKMGYPRSQTRLGKAFETGLLNVPIDDRASIHWYSKAAAQGDAEAELALSGWYLTGARGVLEPDESEAYLWARKSAMKEFPKAEYAMGYYSEVGIGCPTNLEDAKRWYGRAASHHYVKAQQKLEDLRRGRPQRGRQRISRSQRNEECVVM